ncbi:MAG: hypothetical protein ACYCVV_17580 [Acidimicrobiales bacterium]
MSDLAVLSAGFSDRLRRAGVAVTVQQTGRFARSLALTTPASRRELYWTARATLVSGHDQIARFDAVFAQVFGAGLELTKRPLGGDVSAIAPARPVPVSPARPPARPPLPVSSERRAACSRRRFSPILPTMWTNSRCS